MDLEETAIIYLQNSISSGVSTFARSVERSLSSGTDSVSGEQMYPVVTESVPAFAHP